MSARRVVVTGMGVVSPLANSVDGAFDRLHEYKNCIIKKDDLEEYDGLNSHLASVVTAPRPQYSRKVIRTMGEVSILALEATEQAVAQSKLTPEEIQKPNLGIAYGSCSGSINPLLDFYSFMVSKKMANITSGTYLKMMPQTTAVNLSIFYKTHGRLVPTGTACTSGSLAIGNAYELIKYGVQDVMIAGGAEEFSPTQIAVFDTLFATSLRNENPELTPSPYDIDRDGLVIGEGAGTFILEELEHAKARGAEIFAEVVGYCQNTDGTHVTNPNSEMMAEALRGAIKDAKISPSQIGYVNGHGTATKAGDIAETTATRSVFERNIPISSIKSYIGHTLGACGAIEAAMSVKSLNDNWYPPTLNLKNPDPACAELDYIMGEGRKIESEYVMTNNFAFGGVNTSLIFKKWN
ncbi:MAG: beta-ketoacyl-ACP synthase [Kiritimatiellae bacterium]|nr:beta-ketoacyl-ACP synthase [Kiritimatiellia bacterium]